MTDKIQELYSRIYEAIIEAYESGRSGWEYRDVEQESACRQREIWGMANDDNDEELKRRRRAGEAEIKDTFELVKQAIDGIDIDDLAPKLMEHSDQLFTVFDMDLSKSKLSEEDGRRRRRILREIYYAVNCCQNANAAERTDEEIKHVEQILAEALSVAFFPRLRGVWPPIWRTK